jgi:calcineurin-like phosphoesterase family protein
MNYIHHSEGVFVMPNIFFTSDTHWDHDKIIQYSGRPFSTVEEMNETMIDRWNEVVEPGDVVYHLGDFCFTKKVRRVEEIRERLNGSIHWIFGNHDWKKLRTAEGFAWKGDYKKIRVELPDGTKKSIILMHYAMRTWDGSHRENWHLYGHSHGNLEINYNSLSFDVGVDCWDYRPISLDQVIDHMRNFEFVPIDHHGI